MATRTKRSLDLLNEFVGGYTLDWKFCVPIAFRSALDIRQTVRIEKKVEQLVWTQGTNYSFQPGDTFYDCREAYEEDWSTALRKMGFCLKVLAIKSNGNLAVGLFTPEAERKKIGLWKEREMTPARLVVLLRDGFISDMAH